MAESAEHKLITDAFEYALSLAASTKLIGIREADRKTFDYGCVVARDMSRPLVTQVLWKHDEGIEKDIMTLAFEKKASVKVYFFRDTIKNRMRIDECLERFRENDHDRNKLNGLRLIPIMPDLDAASAEQREHITRHISGAFNRDVLFQIFLGNLSSDDVRIFADHGGIIGMKMAALALIDKIGLVHGPTFEQALGKKGSPLREVITMLAGARFIKRPASTNQAFPTLKGRALLDLSRKILFELTTLSQWSDSMLHVLKMLHIAAPEFKDPPDYTISDKTNPVVNIGYASFMSRHMFGINIIDEINPGDPEFYSDFDWSKFAQNLAPGFGPDLFQDADALFFPGADNLVREY